MSTPPHLILPNQILPRGWFWEARVQFLKVNGVTLHHQVISAAAGKPKLVFVNSLGTDFRIWRDVVVRLAGDFSILTYDARGHGLSETGDTPYSIADARRRPRGADRRDRVRPGDRLRRLGRRPHRAGALRDAARPRLGARSSATPPTRSAPTRPGTSASPVVEKDGIEAVADTVLKGWFTETLRNTEPRASPASARC